MKRFDFVHYYSRLEKATNDEITLLRQEHDAFRNSLTEVERKQFRTDFDEYLKLSIDRSTYEIAFLKEMMSNAQPA